MLQKLKGYKRNNEDNDYFHYGPASFLIYIILSVRLRIRYNEMD